MILFLISQIFGILIFLGFNLGLFFYMRFKKNQIINPQNQIFVELRFSILYFFLVLFCVIGMTHRIYSFYYEWDYYDNLTKTESHQNIEPFLETL